jgi:quinol-cytochrome oxidoreductase complex cytochrome b subunit
MFRGLYYGSYKQPRELLWIIGVLIILLMMATAFMGYVLPWGQMSFWAAQVITGFATAIPIFGEDLKIWLWGGPALGTPLLGRFFVLHFLMPFVIFAIVFLHLWALHEKKSNNPLGIDIKGPQDTIPFHPYYTIKDAFGLGVFLIFYLGIVFFWPDIFGEPINYIKADPLNTPHIVPEWYFLPFYAILRAVTFDILFIPAKLIGVVLMVGAIVILFFLPWLDRSPVRSARFRPLYKIFFWVLVADCFLLGTVGAHAPEGIWLILGQLATLYYFAHFLVIMPLLGYVERPLAIPTSISEPVTAQGQGATVAVGGAAE